MVKIRDYKDSDYEDVKINLKEGELYDSTLDSRANLREKIKRNPGSIIVAEVDGHAVGNIYFVEDYWGSLIFRLAVRKKYREKGIGSLLMNETEKRLKKRGIRGVALLVRETELDHLGRYYKKRGYKPVKSMHKVMEKRL